MSVRLVVVAVFAALAVACGSSSRSSVDCEPGRACPTPCSGDGDCSNGEVCGDARICGQRPATSTRYVACVLEADCGRGDFCSLGACTHDCLTDRECTGGAVCSSRGRCIAPEQVNRPAGVTPPVPGKPLVSSDYLDFGSVAETLTFTLSNAGEQSFDFRVLSSRGWLSATPYTGRVVKGSSVTVTVVVDRAAASADGGEGGYLAVNTTAGYLRVGANVSMEMTGSWTGSLRVTTPVDLGDHALVVNVRQTGSVLFGWVDAERSPLYPLEMAVTGSVFSDPGGDAVSFSFDLPSPASRRDLNPAFPKDIIRHFIFTGTRTGPASLTGTFVESFDGIVDNLQVKLSGEATFSRSGVIAEGQADEAPVATVTLTGNPMIGADGSLTAHYASCESGSSAALDNARSYILATDERKAEAGPLPELLAGGPGASLPVRLRGQPGAVRRSLRPAEPSLRPVLGLERHLRRG